MISKLQGYYRQIGISFDQELLRRLAEHEHIALLGPDHGGKSMVLERIQECALALPDVDQPKIVRLMWSDVERCSAPQFLDYVFARLEIGTPGKICEGTRMSSTIFDALRLAADKHKRPIWVLTQNIVGFAKPLTRQLLEAFKAVNDDPVLRERFGVVVTGSADLIPLTYSSNSPFRHAEKLILAGLDRKAAEEFFCESRARVRDGQSVRRISEEIHSEAFSHLYEQTGGRPHLIQALVGYVAHHTFNSLQVELSECWTLDETAGWIKSFVEVFMPYDYHCRSQLREAERDKKSFDFLRRVFEEGDGKVAIPPVDRMQHLEVNGLLVCDEADKANISSPMFRRFIGNTQSDRTIADVYVFQDRWPEAWRKYASLDYLIRERAISSQSHYRLREVMLRWESKLFEAAHEGVDAVVEHFLQGMRYLLNFDAGGLYSKPRASWVEGATFPDAHNEMPLLMDVPANSMPMGSLPGCSLDSERLRLWYDVGVESILPRRESPMLYLERRQPGTEIDTGEHAIISRALEHFKAAYSTAHDIQYRRNIWKLREKYLKVIQSAHKCLLRDPIDLGKLVRDITKEIVETAGYYRVLICLVDPKGEQIQAVSSWCSDRIMDFAAFPDLLKSFDIPSEDAPDDEQSDWDVQAWVVARKETAVISDATDDLQRNPRVQADLAASLGMKAIAVVPMRIGREVVGTMHIERMDKQKPSDEETSLLRNLAEEMAVIFRQAQRLDLLQTSIDVLDDDVKIIDPNKRILYLNPEAAIKVHAIPGWQSGEEFCRCRFDADCPLPEVQFGEPARHYFPPESNDDGRAYDWQMAVIDDFRNKLKPPFKADGTIGYVETVHDLTHLYLILDTAQRALKSNGLRETAKQILDGYSLQGYPRCRIYLAGKDASDRTMLYSYAQKGLVKSENIRLFEEGKIRFYQDDLDNQQPWLIFEPDANHEPVIYRLLPETEKAASYKPSSSSGFGVRYVNGMSYPKELEKEDIAEWIEAPLFVGEEPVGKISLDTSQEPPNPRQRELLRLLVQISALALEHAISVEKEQELKAACQTTEMARKIFHSFRTPLAGIRLDIRTYEKRAQGGTLTPALLGDIMGRMSDHVRRMEVVSGQYMGYIRGYHPAICIGDLMKGLREVCRISSSSRSGRSVRLQTDLDRLVIESDLGALAEAIDELIYNAFTADATEVIVSVGLSGDGRWAEITVQDNGPGVPEYVKPVLFVPDIRKSHGGTGLGLAIVHDTITKLGGDIWLVPTAQGTVFGFKIPVGQQTNGEEI